jgi:hypothetical protein
VRWIVNADQWMADNHIFEPLPYGADGVFHAKAATADRYRDNSLYLFDPLRCVLRRISTTLIRAVVQIDKVNAPLGALSSAGGLVLRTDRVHNDAYACFPAHRDSCLDRLIGSISADCHEFASLFKRALDVLAARIHRFVICQYGMGWSGNAFASSPIAVRPRDTINGVPASSQSKPASTPIFAIFSASEISA